MDKAPDAFRTISEVAEDLDIPQHVLRFWESRFAQIKPMKRAGGRRYYRPDDVDLLRGIRHLLYGEGYTIRGVQRILKDQGPRFVQAVWRPDAAQPAPEEAEEQPATQEGMGSEADVEAGPAETTREPELFEHVRSPASQPATDAEREEVREDSPPKPMVLSGLSHEDQERLEAVLQELSACRRMLDEALAGEAS